jgi:uncharacterized membrane-anchored protein
VQTWGPIVTLNLLSRTVSFFTMLLMMHYLVRMAGLNGPVVKRLKDVWAAFAFLSGWVWISWLENTMDFLPEFDLAQALSPLSFIPHGLLSVALVRLWLAVHPLSKKKEAK